MAEGMRATTVAEIWEGDALNRSKDAEILRTFTIGHLNLRENAGEPRTYVLNLDANWGAGKSFFLNRFKQHLEFHGHIAVYVNAWENDHSDDPFMTVVDEIQTELSSRIEAVNGPEAALKKTSALRKSAAKIIGGAVYSGGKHLITRYIGKEAADGLKELFPGDSEDGKESDGEHGKIITEAMRKSITSAVDAAGEEVLAQFRQQKEVQKRFQEQLKGLGREVLAQNEISSPIFILIDELDRCRPSYAIELLERVKHIFSLENFVYVLGTDARQLANAIKGVYGSEFDGERYLKRFVDRTYHFQDYPKVKLIEFAFKRNGLEDASFEVLPGFVPVSFLSTCFDKVGTQARDIRQIIEVIGTFVASWEVPERKIDLVRLLPLVYQRHFNMPESDLRVSDIVKIRFEFKERRNALRSNVLTRKYDELWREIDNHSISNFESSDPQNSFENWVQHKNYAELSSLGVAKRQEAIGKEYERLLNQVSNITAPSDDG